MLKSQSFVVRLGKPLNALKLMPNAQTDERLRAAWQESWQAIAAGTLAAG